MVEKQVPRSIVKQSDKEVKWEDIPEEERHPYHAAEAKQWAEHFHYGVVRIHGPQEAEWLRQAVPRARILRARFAYRCKNVAKRREDSTIPAKPRRDCVRVVIWSPT